MSIIRYGILVILFITLIVPTTAGYAYNENLFHTHSLGLFAEDGSLSGYVKDTSMNPIQGALIRVSYHDTYQENYSDASGYYHVTNIPICYCMKNATCSKLGYQTASVQLSIYENTTYDFTLHSLNLTCYPVFTGMMGNGGWYISCVNVSFVVNGDIDAIFYGLDGQPWNQYLGPFQICDEGYHIFKWYSTYQGDSSAESAVPFGIDWTGPSLSVSSEKVGISHMRITALVTDEYGIDRVEFYVDGDLFHIGHNGPTEEIMVRIGSHQMEVVAFDIAGNSANSTLITSCHHQVLPHNLGAFFSKLPLGYRFMYLLRLMSD